MGEVTAIMPTPEWDTPLEWWSLERVLSEYRPGSHGDDWTWQDEYDHLLKSDEHRERTEALAGDLSLNPMHWPICLGTDGRVWDGHHRIVAAMYLGMQFVLVEPPENGRSEPCSNYTARSWSPGSEQPEDARCVNCNQSHGPAVGGSESRVAPGQLADEERSAPPTDLGLDSGSLDARDD